MSVVSVLDAATRSRGTVSSAARVVRRRAHILMELDATAVRTRVLAGEVVAWEREAPVASPAERAQSLTSLLQDAARQIPRRFSLLRRPRCRVTLHEPFARLKPLAGLPSPCDQTVLRRIVEQGVDRFFISATPGSKRVAVHRLENGTVWAAAYDAAVVSELVLSCEAAGIRLERIQPHVRLSGGAAEANPHPYVEAVALTGFRSPMPSASHRRLSWLAVMTGVLALIIAAVAHPLRHQQLARHANVELRALSPQLSAAGRQHVELREVTAELTEIARFAQSRRSVVQLLSLLSTAMPNGAIATSVTIDSAGATLGIAANDVAATGRAIEQAIPGVSVQLVGPIGQEASALDGALRQRGTMRIRLHASSSGDAGGRR